MKVYVVVHDFFSHDMILDRGGNPEVVGVYSTLAEAKKHVRPQMDDFVLEWQVDSTKHKRVYDSYS